MCSACTVNSRTVVGITAYFIGTRTELVLLYLYVRAVPHRTALDAGLKWRRVYFSTRTPPPRKLGTSLEWEAILRLTCRGAGVRWTPLHSRSADRAGRRDAVSVAD